MRSERISIDEAFARYLQDQAPFLDDEALTLGTNLFVDTIPDSPDACVAVYGDWTSQNDLIWERTITIRRRDKAASGEKRREGAVIEYLMNVLRRLYEAFNVDLVNGTHVIKFNSVVSPPESIGQDELYRDVAEADVVLVTLSPLKHSPSVENL